MEKRDLGILLIHGIGEQEEGQTLLEFGQPVLEWIRDWVQGGEQLDAPRVEVVNSSLSSSEFDQFTPAHATVRLRPHAADETEYDWVIAEGWWGGLVQPPSFSKVAGWMLTVGAWTILLHVTKRLFLVEDGKEAGVLRQVLALGLWLILTILLQLLVVILSILAIIPIPPLRTTLSRILLFTTGFIGDSYVITRSDFQRSAIVNRARQSLVWLGRRCEKVVVVAHSQGAAVAHLALRDGTLGIRGPEAVDLANEMKEKLRLLITFGSGLGKLEALTQLGRASKKARFASRAAPLVVFISFLSGYAVANADVHVILEYAAVGLIIVVMAMLIAVRHEAKNHWTRFLASSEKLSLANLWPNMSWYDVWATHDPVPNGSLVPDDKRVQGLTSRVTANLRSFISDHTGYWNNRADFVRRVVFAIDRVAGLWHLDHWPSDDFDRLVDEHERHVKWHVITRLITVASIGVLLVLFYQKLAAWGQQIVTDVSGLLPETLLRILGYVAAAVQAAVPPLASPTVGYVLAGSVLPIAAIGFYRYLYGFAWRWWENRTTDRVLRRQPREARFVSVAVDSIEIGLGFAPLFVVLGARFIRNLSLSQILVVSAQFFLLLLFVGMVLSLFSVEAGRRSDGRKRRFPPVSVLFQRLLAVGFFGASLPFFFDEYAPFLEQYQHPPTLWILGSILVGSGFRKETVDEASRKYSLSSGVRMALLTAPFSVGIVALLVAGIREGFEPVIEMIKVGAIAYAVTAITVQGVLSSISSREPEAASETAVETGTQAASEAAVETGTQTAAETGTEVEEA